MSSNSTAAAEIDDGVVLAGGYIFFIAFCGAGLFFSFIMFFVCCSEYKKYKNRKPRPPFQTGGDYPKQPPPDVPPVTYLTAPNASYPKQQYETLENPSSSDGQDTIVEIHQEDQTNLHIVDPPSNKSSKLPPLLDLNKGQRQNSVEPESIFSPTGRMNSSSEVKVAFTNHPLPSIHIPTDSESPVNTSSLELKGAVQFSEKL